MGANPHANGGKVTIDLHLPEFRQYAVSVPLPGVRTPGIAPSARRNAAGSFVSNREDANFRLFCPDEINSNRLGAVFEVENRAFVGRRLSVDDHISPDGRVMEVLSEHNCEGWLEGYMLTGRHGMFVTYESFAMVSASMTVQHTKWLQEATSFPGERRSRR